MTEPLSSRYGMRFRAQDGLEHGIQALENKQLTSKKIEQCWLCGFPLSELDEEGAYAHLDRCYAKGRP